MLRALLANVVGLTVHFRGEPPSQRLQTPDVEPPAPGRSAEAPDPAPPGPSSAAVTRELSDLALDPRTGLIITSATTALVADDLEFHAVILAYLEAVMLARPNRPLTALRCAQLGITIHEVQCFADALSAALAADDPRILIAGMKDMEVMWLLEGACRD